MTEHTSKSRMAKCTKQLLIIIMLQWNRQPAVAQSLVRTNGAICLQFIYMLIVLHICICLASLGIDKVNL